ncbi:MAG: hypothetical protein PVI90_00520 [Desulfobacteraceae bacterium]
MSNNETIVMTPKNANVCVNDKATHALARIKTRTDFNLPEKQRKPISQGCKDAYYRKAEKTLDAMLCQWQRRYERLTVAETLMLIQKVTTSVTLTLLQKVLLNQP